MEWIRECAVFARAFRLGPKKCFTFTLAYLWGIYSKPRPGTRKEFLVLLLLCSAVATVAVVLFHHWMSGALTFGTVACVCGAAFLLLFLVHPFRCAFTVILPTLGTKQGRKLIISTATMLLMLNTMPNIGANVSVATHLMTCTSDGLAQSLVNSTAVLNRAKVELIAEAMKVPDFEFHRTLRDFDHFTYINVSGVKQRFDTVSQHIENNFSHAKRVLEEAKLVTNRILAVFFIMYLFFESASYLKSYLKNVKFDNIYITRQLVRMACENGIQIDPSNMKGMVNSTSFTISLQEFQTCVPRIVVVSLYLIVTVLMIVLDYTVYHLVTASMPWILGIPTTSIYITLQYEVRSCFLFAGLLELNCQTDVLVDFQKRYFWSFGTEPGHCRARPSEPDNGIVYLLGLLFLAAYGTVLLEVYAKRSRRAVCSSFFKAQEEKRINRLYCKILSKQKKKGSVFVIEATRGRSCDSNASKT